MSDTPIPDEILVITGRSQRDLSDYEPRRGEPSGTRIPGVESIQLTQLQEQINVFVSQLNLIMQDTPEGVGAFRMMEFEVSAGIVVEGKGGIKLAWFANAEVGAAVNAALKFTFRRASPAV